MSLWMLWWNAIGLLRPAFSRRQTFLWFAIAMAGFTVRTDMSGATSIVGALNINPRCCNEPHWLVSTSQLPSPSKIFGPLWAVPIPKRKPSTV